MPTQIDRETFESLKQMTDGPFVGQLVDIFIEDTPRQIGEMKAALAAGDQESFRRAAHSVKSNAATFGALQLSELARDLERLGKEGQLPEAQARLAAFEAAFGSAADELRGLIQ